MATETHWRSTLIALSSDRFLSILFKAIQLCQVLCVQNGHEHVLCVVGWCVDSLPDLLSDLKLYSDPEPPCPPVNVVTSLCCECEYQHLPPSAHSPPLVYLCIHLFICFFVFCCGLYCQPLFKTAEDIVNTSILFFHVLFWDHFWNFFFHYLWTVMKILKLSKWSTVYWIPYIHKKYINYLCIVRLIALWVIVISAWNSSGCSVNINGGCPHVHMELTVCVRVREWSEYIMYASGFMFNMTSSDTCIVYL